MVEKSVKEKVMEKKDLILGKLGVIAAADVLLKHDEYNNLHAEAKREYKDFKEYYYKHTDLSEFLHKIYNSHGIEYNYNDVEWFDSICSWEEFKTLFYDDFVDIIDSEVEIYNDKEELEKSGFVSVRESILEAITGYLEGTIEEDYQQFLDATIYADYYKDSEYYNCIDCYCCIDIHVSKTNFDFYDEEEDSMLRSIYYYVDINTPAGRMYIENIYDDYDEFEELYYDDYLEIMEKIVKKFNEQAKTDIENEVFRRLNNFFTTRTSLYREIYKAEVKGKMLQEVFKKTTDLTEDEIKEYFKEISDKITDKIMEGKRFTICIKSRYEISIRIKNECCIEELMLIPA